MPILPEEIAGATFERVRQGYQPDEVHAFLRGVAADYAATLEKISLDQNQPAEFDVGKEVNRILLTARDSASRLTKRAHNEAQALQKAAIDKAKQIETETSAASTQMIEQSSRDAKQTKLRADESAFELRSRIENETRQRVANAESRSGPLFAYNQQLLEQLDEIGRVVIDLRTEIDGREGAEPAHATDEEQRVG
jgi:DivIVA domain-containing protein